jgi:hypothetical protein
MVKIWEIDFTNFSGTGNDEPQDNVGTGHLNLVTGTPAKVSPLPQFNNRPGVRFEETQPHQGYQVDGSDADSVARFQGSYTPTQQRSFVMWFYPHGVTESTAAHQPIWLGRKSSGAFSSGFSVTTSGTFNFWADVHTERYETSAIGLNTWHLAVMTVDRGSSETVYYFDGSPVYSGSTLPPLSLDNCWIGELGTTWEPEVSLGYVATYDHILSEASVSGIYSTFLIDSLSGDDPAFTLSGTVRDSSGTSVSGAPLYLINVSDNQLYETSESSTSGTYSINVPYSGDYVLATANVVPNIGARALSLTASGVAGSGSITFHDGT